MLIKSHSLVAENPTAIVETGTAIAVGGEGKAGGPVSVNGRDSSD